MKNVLKKFMIVIMTVTCLCALVNVQTTTVEAKSETVSMVTTTKATKTKKKTPYLKFTGTVNAYIGQQPFSNQLVTTGKVTYKSSKKSVATVSKKGKITIKGLGTTTITCKAKASKDYIAKTVKFKVKVTKERSVVTGNGNPKVLIIGDSFAYRNDRKAGGIWGNFIELARDNNKNPTTDMFYVAGSRLLDVANGAGNVFANSIVPKSKSLNGFLGHTTRKYDYIVLQYDSSEGLGAVCKILDKWQPQAKRILYLPHCRDDFSATAANLWEEYYLLHAKEYNLYSCIRGTRAIYNMGKYYYGSASKACKNMIRDEKGHLGADGYFAMGVAMYKTIFGTNPSVSPTYFYFDNQRHVREEFTGLNYTKAKQIIKLVPANISKVYNIKFYNKDNEIITDTNYWANKAVKIPSMSDYTDAQGLHIFRGWSATPERGELTTVTGSFKDATYYAVYELAENLTDGKTTVEKLETSYEYTGSAITPDITVTRNGTALVKDKDYTLTFVNNVEAGTATITITGKGKYLGTLTKTFLITMPLSTEENEVIEEEVEVTEEEIVTEPQEELIEEIIEETPTEEVIEEITEE